MKFLKFRFVLTLLSSLLTLQFLYYFHIYHLSVPSVENVDLVVVFGGKTRRSEVGLALANRLQRPLFLSEVYGGTSDVQHHLGKVLVPLTTDPRARTTDQNARGLAKFIQTGGFHRIALVTSWYHMPRSLFLANLYWGGAGIEIIHYPAEPLPEGWWNRGDFYSELVKFWGSLGRVGLAAVGIKNGPK